MFEFANHRFAELLYLLSTALLLPVMLIVTGLLVLMLLAVGGLLREWTERRAIREGLRSAARLSADPMATPGEIWQALADIPCGLPRRLTAQRRGVPESAVAGRALLVEVESDVTNRLARLGFVTRVGPMFGLLGTLIPFGPALSGLSSGNLQQLSANLITAFATTVIGLSCGCLAYGIEVVRRSWYSHDFDVIEYVVNELASRCDNEPTEATKMEFRS